MQKVRGITELRDYGKVQINLKDLMDKHDINVYRMSILTGLKYNTIKSYYNNAPLTKVDLDVVAKMCYVLNCSIADIFEYVNPQN